MMQLPFYRTINTQQKAAPSLFITAFTYRNHWGYCQNALFYLLY